MRRFWLIYVAVLGALLAAWVWIAVYSVQGLRGLRDMDPRNPPGEASAVPPAPGPRTGPGRSLLWFGDSVSTSIRKDDPVDARTPCLMALVRMGLARRGSAGARAWDFRALQDNGYDGIHFVKYAQYLEKIGRYPDVAVVGINMRSLNRLGQNGFFGPFRSDPFGEHPLTVEFIPEYCRGLSAWTGDLVRSLFHVEKTAPSNADGKSGAAPVNGNASNASPDFLPGAAAPERPSLDGRMGVEKGYKVVYGSGYSLDRTTLEALVDTGLVLRKGGTLVLYYVTPLDARQLRAREGNSTASELERSVREVDARLRSQGFDVLDVHDLLAGGFIEPPSEHLGAKSRITLSRCLVAWIRESAGDRVNKSH